MSQLMDSSVARQFERLPPHSIEAEMCLLASMMLDKEIVGQVVQIVDREAFYQADHQIVYDVLVKLYEQNRPIDAVILREELAKRQLLEEIGGVAYLAQILNTVPSAAHGAHYAGIVREKALLRQLIAASNDVLRDAYAPHEQADLVLDKAEKKIFEIAQKKVGGALVPMEDVLHEVFEMIENRGQRGVSTRFLELDDMLNGLQKGEMVIIAARPSMGKCVAADTEVLLADGRLATIEQVCSQRTGELLTLNEGEGRFHRNQPSDFIDDGIKPVFRVTTRLGRFVDCTLSHPFLTIRGWKRLVDLKPRDRIGVPRVLNAFGHHELPEHQAKLLGYLLGDGGLTNPCPRFTNADPRVREDFLEALREFGGVCGRIEDSDGTRTPSICTAGDRGSIAAARSHLAHSLQAVLDRTGRSARNVALELDVSPSLVWQWVHGKSSPDEETAERLCLILGVDAAQLFPAGTLSGQKNVKNRLTCWLETLGLMDKSAAEKFVPELILRATRPAVALFLNRLFATDGWASVLSSGQAQLGYATTSHRLARQIQHLLLRFGIIASLKARAVKYNGTSRRAWQLDITDAHAIRAFIAQIGIFGKVAALDRVSSSLRFKQYRTNRDLIPAEVWKEVAAAKGALPWAEVSRRLGFGPGHQLHVEKRALSRRRMTQLAQALQSERLRKIAESELYWDQIKSIEYLGKKQVYDLTIPHTHNFVANDICVHNTAMAMNIIENIAADERLPCAVFSLEMSKQQLAQRMLCSRGGIDAHKLRKGLLNSEEYTKLANVVGELAKAPIWVDDSPGLTPLELRAKARRLKLQHDVTCIMIDYMQLMDNPGPESRQQQISEISRAIKQVARELNVPVIALSQLNRQSEGRDGHRPRMSDLRESGSIEQDADVIMLLHREDYYKMSEPDFQPDNIAEVIIAKQRNGPTGTVKLTFDSRTTRFRNLAEQNDPFG